MPLCAFGIVFGVWFCLNIPGSKCVCMGVDAWFELVFAPTHPPTHPQEVTTRTADDTIGTKLSFDRNGKLASSVPTARGVGTTVRILGLFKAQPVRFKQFQKYAKVHFADCVSLLQAYAVVASGSRVIGKHRTKKGGRSQFLSTQSTKEMNKRIAAVFGTKFLRSLAPVDVQFRLGEGGDGGGGSSSSSSSSGSGSGSGGGSTEDGVLTNTQTATSGQDNQSCRIKGFVSKVGR